MTPPAYRSGISVRQQPRDPFVRAVPMVRIRFPPAETEIGTTVLLGSYHFGRPHGVYWTPSPVFLHAGPCDRFEQSDIVPQIVRHRLVSVRVYDTDDMCLYDLGGVCDGTDVER